MKKSPDRDDILERLGRLPPEKRALLVAHLEKKREQVKGTLAIPSVPREAGTNAFPLSLTQERLWMLHQLAPQHSPYNLGSVLRLSGALDREALQRSLEEIVRRHEPLRTTFTTVDGQLVQVVAPALNVQLPMVDLCGLPGENRKVEMHGLVARLSGYSFDLARGPLIQAALLGLDEDDRILVVTMPQIVTDGRSTEILIQEVATLYRAFAAGDSSPLPDPPVQYADFAVWQREQLQGDALQEQLDYWQRQLDGAPPALRLLTDYPRPRKQTLQGGRRAFALSHATVEALKTLGQREGCTLFMTLLAAFDVLLHQYAGQETVLVGSPIDGCSHLGLERVVGFFAGTLVLRTDLEGDPTFRELLARVRRSTRGAYAHQDLPFEMLVDRLQSAGGHLPPQIQVFFVFRDGAGERNIALPDLSVTPLDLRGMTARFDIEFRLENSPQGLDGALTYKADIFEGVTVARMLAHFETLLESVLAKPDVRLSELPLPPDLERLQELAPQHDAGERVGQETAVLPRTPVERQVAAIWGELLELDRVGIHENFFELGGHSLLLGRMHQRLQEALGRDIPLVHLFQYPTIHDLADYLTQTQGPDPLLTALEERGGRYGGDLVERRENADDVAIIGLAGRFPGADTIRAFWENLCGGVESVTSFTVEELVEAGCDPDAVSAPNYVRSRPILEGIEDFDAEFFGIRPREAMVMDPQQRLFLECCWEALEDAGCDSEVYPGWIGVFGGVGPNGYRYNNLWSNRGRLTGNLADVSSGNERDYLTTRVSYKLDLKGPSLDVQCACSTALVTVHLACRSLLDHDCDVALAGGATVWIPQKRGYTYREGYLLSPDGRCRPFDARAQGTIFGSGVGVVALKRLSEALRDGDHVYAVIKGSAVTNDGSAKVSFQAPGVDGQRRAIALAQRAAGVDPRTIGYVEAHGTGTSLGDPIEVEALTQAFRTGTDERQFCALGSVKGNIGHLDAAAGVAGLIKTALSLHHKMLPPSINYETANPEIDFASSPFYVNAESREWEAEGWLRRAGVSSFGLGGTNAHVILEEAPEIEPSGTSRPYQLLALSARTEAALEAATDNLRAHLEADRALNLADVAYTLHVGRRAFARRRVVLCETLDDAVSSIRERDPQRTFTGVPTGSDTAVVFMFPGQGAQYVNMGRDLYRREPVFREQVDECIELLSLSMDLDFSHVLYPALGTGDAAAERLGRTALAQPALFVIEYALARLWMSWGVEPAAMIGHSIGEYVAACLAGVFSLEDALALVAERGRLMQEMPPGAMLSVSTGEAQVRPLLDDSLAVAAVNAPDRCVISGPTEAVGALERRLVETGIAVRRLHTSHAFHSSMMDPALGPFEERVRKAAPRAPRIPFVSNVTGAWITAEEATDPAYWARHMRRTVRFADGMSVLAQAPERVLLEVGPGHTLRTLAQRHPERKAGQVVLSSMRHPRDEEDDQALLLRALGQLWLAGVAVDWTGFYRDERRLRLPLPTYPFQRQRYWVEPADVPAAPPLQPAAGDRKADIADWFYEPVWETSPVPEGSQVAGTWLIFEDAAGWGAAVASDLEEQGASVVRVRAGERFAREADGAFAVRPGVLADYCALMDALRDAGEIPEQIVHLWSVDDGESSLTTEDAFQAAQRLGFYSLLRLARALGRQDLARSVQITVVSRRLFPVADGAVRPEQATLLGPCLVIPQEYGGIRCRVVDADSASGLAAELASSQDDWAVAYRDGARYVRRFEPRRLDARSGDNRLRPGGVYVIVGGLGNIGLTLAGYLAGQVKAKLVLTSRSGLPAREAWDGWLADHEGDTTSRKILAVRALEAAGAEVLVLAADVEDEAQMRSVIDQAHARFGELNGVIHAAGSAGNAVRLIDAIERADCEGQFAAKVQGMIVLDRVLEGGALDFCFVCSSLSAILGGIGFAAYAAANQFLDAYVHQHNRRDGTPWISVDWDAWDFGGRMVVGDRRAALADLAMTPEEGQRAFALALESGATRLVHSTGDLQSRYCRWVALEPGQAEPALGPAAHARPALTTAYVPAGTQYEKQIAAIWQDVLGVEDVGIFDNFFDLGGDSMLGMQVISRMREAFSVSIPAVALYEAPTVNALVEYLHPEGAVVEDQWAVVLAERRRRARQGSAGQGVAIISMAGRFPGAETVERLWENLCDGKEFVTTFTDEELQAAGVSPELFNDPNYVRARPIIENVDMFDAPLFGYSPRDAELLDPQYRLFLECAWEALERSGYNNPDIYPGDVGVFAGVGMSTYTFRWLADPRFKGLRVPLTADKDAFATTVSYKLNLTGPAFTVQTFCSTSLVSTHLACQSLLNGECDVALTGGVTVRVPQKRGSLYQEGGMESPDGHTRSFGDRANGMAFGDGVGVVVLKRLEDALEDGDVIHAVIRGSAVNNDGALKVGYTAPSVVGQSRAISTALENAGVSSETIGFVEAHGSATKMGDPIEVEALTQAFRQRAERKQYCALGSVKSNVGHLDRAAGVTGLIKAALAVKHGVVPPSLHFERPNPEIDFENSPFFVNAQLLEWPLDDGTLRRAGVNSLGLGGTNAHVIVEQPPRRAPSGPSRAWQLLLLSARTESALERMADDLARYLGAHEETSLPDVAYTLQVGRRAFPYRRMVVCRDVEGALCNLSSEVTPHYQPDVNRRVVFMFPGVGDHYLQMARELYDREEIFRETFDQCDRILQPLLGLRLYSLLYSGEQATVQPEGDDRVDLRAMLGRDERAPSPAAQRLSETAVAHPAVFVIDYALARLLMSWGIRPGGMVGYSLGEYVAACLSGVLSLRDALRLVARRAQMIQSLPAGGMLAVSLPKEEACRLLTEGVSLAAHNGESMCVLSGLPEAIAGIEAELAEQGVACRRLETRHAFHSHMMNSLAEDVVALVQEMRLNPPQIPYLSNLSGTWITAEEATDPNYWTRQMCSPLRFFENLDRVLQEEGNVLLEVGPGQALGSFAKQHPACTQSQIPRIMSTMRHAYERRSDVAVLLEAVGKLWMLGCTPDWHAFYAAETRRFEPLPTYPFERQSYWIDAGTERDADARSQAGLVGETSVRKAVEDWFYLPGWKQTPPAPPVPNPAKGEGANWLLFAGAGDLGERVATWLMEQGRRTVVVRTGESFERLGELEFALRPRQAEDYVALLEALREQGIAPDKIVHMWSAAEDVAGDASVERALDLGFYSLMGLIQAVGELGLPACEISIVSSSTFSVTGIEDICPVKATVVGPARVIPVEYPDVACRLIDVAVEPADGRRADALLANLQGELASAACEPVVALRGRQRWVESFEPLRLPSVDGGASPVLRQGGVYLVTGGLGGIGLAMAERLARTVDARLVLVSRSGLPPCEQWSEILTDQGDRNGVGRRIRHVRDLEARGTEVLVVKADVADEAQMRAAVGEALARFGTIHGVIHAAGVPGEGLIQFKSPEMAAQVLAPKVQGTVILERVLRSQGVELDFLALFSSSTSITGGGPGQVDYCAANAFLDAYARRCARDDGRVTVSIDWGEWKWNAWEKGLADLGDEVRAFLKRNREQFGIAFEEGYDALGRVLQRGLPQVIVSSQAFRRDGRTGGDFTIASILNRERQAGAMLEKHARPTLGVPYLAPRDDLERRVAEVWGEVLGVSQVGVNDNFFDLGGNSLVGLELVRRLQEVPDIEQLPARVLYEAPTVSALVQFVKQERNSVDIVDERYSRGERRRQMSRQQAVRRRGKGIDERR
jgi:acyl transferase domain-containing protein/acyl carrier protein